MPTETNVFKKVAKKGSVWGKVGESGDGELRFDRRFLDSSKTGGETWMHLTLPETKQDSKPETPVLTNTRKIKVQLFPKKLMAIVFWKIKSVSFVDTLCSWLKQLMLLNIVENW